MKINIKVKTNSKNDLVEKVDSDQYDYKVSLKAIRENGKANESLIKLLADYFQISTANVNILLGHKNSIKLVEIS